MTINEETMIFIENSEKEEVNCDICGCSDNEVINEIGKDNSPITSVICVNCGLIYISPRMKKEYYDKFYENHYYKGYDGLGIEKYTDETESSINFANKIIRTLKNNNIEIENKRVLDIGCGRGYVLYPFKKDYGCFTYGIDPHNELFEKGNKDGLNLHKGKVEDIEGKFDIVIMANIIEHLLNPKESLKKVRSHLSNNGVIYASQSGIYTTKYALGYDIDDFFCVEHTYAYSLRTFSNLLHKTGFEVIYGNEGIHTLARKSDLDFKIDSDYFEMKEFIDKCKRKKFKNIRKILFDKSYPLLSKLKPLGLGWRNKVGGDNVI